MNRAFAMEALEDLTVLYVSQALMFKHEARSK